ncbi:unnamed protein product, partial [Lampetra planeri]
HYSPELCGKCAFQTAPAYSLAGRGKESIRTETPGPAAYCLPSVLGPKTVDKPASPAFSLCHRTGSFNEDHQESPGPATYNVVDPCIYGNKTPQYSMPGRHARPDHETRYTPGPGSHSLGQ